MRLWAPVLMCAAGWAWAGLPAPAQAQQAEGPPAPTVSSEQPDAPGVLAQLARADGDADQAQAPQQPGRRPPAAPGRGPDAGGKPEAGQEPVTPPARERAKPAPDLNRLFGELDPGQFNLSGAELEVQVVGDTVILQGSEEDLKKLELLIEVMEQTRGTKVLEVVTVEQKDANEIARSVEQALRNAFDTPNLRTEDELSITALSSNILLVSALPEQIDYIVDVIKQVDAVPPALGKVEQMTFMVKNRRASGAAEQLKEIIDKIREKQGARGAEGELQIIPNDSNNSIMVLAPESERATIEKLLAEIDVEPAKGWGEVQLALYPLLHSDANELADTITQLLETQEGRDAAEETIKRLSISRVDPTTGESVELAPINLERNLRIIPDEGTNSLIVATIEENIEPMGELIRLLDGVAVAEEMGVRMFPLRFADAETLKGLLDDLFSDGKGLPEEADGGGEGRVPEGPLGEALVYNVSISADQRTNTLLVAGRPEQLLFVQMVIDELDVPARSLKFPLRMISLEYADATRVGQMITELVDQRISALEGTGSDGSAIERERVFLSVDIRSNSLVLSASEENFDEITEIARTLDTKPVRLFDQIRVLKCGRLSAADLKSKIEDLWERKAQLRQEDEQIEDMPVLVADDRSNALVIASNQEDYDEIEGLVTKLGAQPMIEMTQLFALEYADATVLAQMLDELFQGMESASDSEAFRAPTIIADPRSNSLIVAGMQDVMERAADLVKRLDIESGPMTATFAIYSLKHGSAVKLATRMQELFDTRQEGQDREASPVAVLADEATNSLVCLASRDDHTVIVDLLRMLDRPSSLATQFEIFPLRFAKADLLADKLGTLFESQAEGASGRTDAQGVEVDERTNSLIVWASPTEMENIREVISKLDTAEPVRDMMVRMVRLKQALAEDFAQLIEDTLLRPDGSDENEAVILSFRHTRPDGSTVTRKLLRQDIVLSPDSRTNSLLVMAPAESMDMLESMIEDFDQIRPVNSEIRLFPLLNSDAEGMVEQLTELFQGDTGGGAEETQSQLVFGGEFADIDFASVGQELRFTADRRTNTIIAAGAEVDLRMIEELIRYLDAQDTEERVTVVYKARHRKGDELASAVQGFIQQEDEPLSEIDDQISQLRRAERMVSVEAVGDEESSNSLLVGVSPRYYERTMRMIEELDRPEPQVMLRVLIAEVQLQDNLGLGMEFAGQDLAFSEHAVLHPNTGLPIGPDFDYVLGTALGAAGLGGGNGLSFTMTGEDFSFLLRTFQTNSRLEVLSRPVVMVENGQEGKITIADQIPVATTSIVGTQGGIQTSVGREAVGIVLTARPQISPDGYVSIEIEQEISNFSGENIQITEGVSQPIINDRTVSSKVTLRDGETVVIGGLITDRKSEGDTKIPLLGDIPIIGAVFRSTEVTHQKTELLVVLNVNVLRTDEDRRNFSIEERDKSGLLTNLSKNPLMGGLQIKPDESLLGPQPRSAQPAGGAVAPGYRPDAVEEPQHYGPKPKVYGPVINEPEATTTASARSAPPDQVQAAISAVLTAPPRSLAQPRVFGPVDGQPQAGPRPRAPRGANPHQVQAALSEVLASAYFSPRTETFKSAAGSPAAHRTAPADAARLDPLQAAIEEVLASVE